MSTGENPVGDLMSSKRILVLGPCGSGKTRLTRQLSHILDLPAIHLDAKFWRPGWISTPQTEWRNTVSELVKQDSWVMDGTYESTLDIRIPAADVIVMINRPRWSCLWGVVRRSLYYKNRTRPDAPSGQPIDFAYLRYIWRYPAVTDVLVCELIEEYARKMPVIRLSNLDDAEAFIASVKSRVSG